MNVEHRTSNVEWEKMKKQSLPAVSLAGSDVRCQMSDVRCRMSDVGCQIFAGYGFQVSI